MNPSKPVVLMTGNSGLIGERLACRLKNEYTVVGIDLHPPEGDTACDEWIKCDLTKPESIQAALHMVRDRHGDRIASVVHLAAYYDFSGEPSPLYQELTVNGTRRLLQALQQMQVEQFIFSSTLLVMKSSDEIITEDSPLEAEWDYPQSKVETEQIIREEQKQIPAVVLRIAGVYDEDGHSLPVGQQICRIYEKQLESYFFPGDKSSGQSFVHLDDLNDCISHAIDRRAELDPYEVFLVGEEDVMSYGELQDRIGELIHGKEWTTIRIPKAAAKAGAWVKEKLARSEDEEPFIKPWMISLADQNYRISAERARRKLGWTTHHTLRKTLPEMIRRLKADPRGWYLENKFPLPKELEEADHE